MKKFIYISGVLLVNVFVIGCVFKIFHWPGANLMILSGLALLSLVFIPVALRYNYVKTGKKKTMLYVSAFVCVLLCFAGALFKIMHWPGAALLLIVTSPLPFLFFLPVYLYHNKKNEPNQSLNFIGVILLLLYVAVFSSLMALNISRDILNSMSMTSGDFQQQSQIVRNHNVPVYDNPYYSGNEFYKDLKLKTRNIDVLIDNTQKEILALTEGDTKGIWNDSTGIDYRGITNPLDNHMTAAVMYGKEGNSGRALEIKKAVEDYKVFLIRLIPYKPLKELIESLLNTDDRVSFYEKGITSSWENTLFGPQSYMITVLGNLSSVKLNVHVVEMAVLNIRY